MDMGIEKSELEEEVARGIRESMQKRHITDTKGHLKFLRNQKIIKRDASKARVIEAEMEISVIDKMMAGAI